MTRSALRTIMGPPNTDRRVASHAPAPLGPVGAAAAARTARRAAGRWAMLLGASAAWACADAPTAPRDVPPPSPKAAKFWEVLASTRWNERATDLLQLHAAPSNGQAWASRMLTYLSLAQYRAALAASAVKGRTHPSVSAAVARASATVLTDGDFFGHAFYANAGVPAAIEQWLVADRTAPQWPGERNQDVAAGEAIGLAVARAVLAQARADGYLSLTAPTPPTGVDGAWVAAGAAIRSLWGATPFFLDRAPLYDLRPEAITFVPPPPAFGSPELAAALDELRAITGTRAPNGTILTVGSRTPAQLAIAHDWNKLPPAGPYTAGEWNRIAAELIESHHRKELEATRILAYANAAAFDAQIACFAAKFTFWVARPSQVDRTIATAFAPPNHPSYPSAHSCISSAFAAVLSEMLPRERRALGALVEEAGWSRVYAGIHYRFDVEAGQQVGQFAAAAALAGSLE